MHSNGSHLNRCFFRLPAGT